jgi:hypothetical protein
MCRILLTSIYGEIESEDAFVVGRPPNHFRMAQGMDRVVIPSPPMLFHALTREFAILRWPLIVLGAVDQLHDVVDLSINRVSQQCGL